MRNRAMLTSQLKSLLLQLTLTIIVMATMVVAIAVLYVALGEDNSDFATRIDFSNFMYIAGIGAAILDILAIGLFRWLRMIGARF